MVCKCDLYPSESWLCKRHPFNAFYRNWEKEHSVICLSSSSFSCLQLTSSSFRAWVTWRPSVNESYAIETWCRWPSHHSFSGKFRDFAQHFVETGSHQTAPKRSHIVRTRTGKEVCELMETMTKLMMSKGEASSGKGQKQLKIHGREARSNLARASWRDPEDISALIFINTHPLQTMYAPCSKSSQRTLLMQWFKNKQMGIRT